MSTVAQLICDLEGSAQSGAATRRVEILRQITDLFLLNNSAMQPEQIAVFDTVMLRLTAALETRARAEFAKRLADVVSAPPQTIIALAHDEIEVAAPVLTHSPQLSSEDLVGVALAKGDEHHMAVSAREHLHEDVTDILMTVGSPQVQKAVMNNPTARLSKRSLNIVALQANADEALQDLLQSRTHVPHAQLEALLPIAKASVQQKLTLNLSLDNAADTAVIKNIVETCAQDIDQTIRTDSSVPIVSTYTQQQLDLTYKELEKNHVEGQLSELVLADYALSGNVIATICGLSIMAGIKRKTAEELFQAADHDLLLIICKSQNWAWSTARALLKARGASRVGQRQIDQAFESYSMLNYATAQRILRFLHVRERVEV
jgi:hypothetical protein